MIHCFSVSTILYFLAVDCLKHLGELVTSLGGAVGGPQAIKNLVSSYQALTAECGILASWLSDLIISAPPPPLNTRVVPTSEATLSSSFSTSSSSFLSLVGKDLITTSANAVRTIAENIIGSIAKEKFSKTGGDSILRLSKAEAAFLEDMMDSERWRHLLIDLSAANKDSALLMYVAI